ncbi:MAG: hypothetical protein JXA78_19520, partial [Anaerolineales bacterium]|nr:hypothetical protein [Anaerolineales bacterium]
PASGNLHLLESASAAIDQAATLAQVSDDYDGQARPAGEAPDVGADEYIEPDSWVYLPLLMQASGARFFE